MTDLGLVLQRVQARDDPRKFLVRWRGLFLVSLSPRTRNSKGPDIQKSNPIGCKPGTARVSSPGPEKSPGILHHRKSQSTGNISIRNRLGGD